MNIRSKYTFHRRRSVSTTKYNERSTLDIVQQNCLINTSELLILACVSSVNGAQWNITERPARTKYLDAPSTPLSINGASLPYVSSWHVETLESFVTSDFTPTVHINDIVFKAHQRANAIHWCFTWRNTDLLVRAYCVYVRSLLELHNSVIWSPHSP